MPREHRTRAAKNRAYCRRCRKWHKVREGRAYSVFDNHPFWFVDCPKVPFYITPARNERNTGWLPV